MLNTNKINKETLKALGLLLRNNKGLNEMKIHAGKQFLTESKKEFCEKVLELLEAGTLLQIQYITREGYFGQTMNIDYAMKLTDIKSIDVQEYAEAKRPQTRAEAISNWTLD